MSKTDKWIYKSNGDQTVIIRPTVVAGVYNSAGTMIPGSGTKLTPIKLVFDNGIAFVDEAFARKNKTPLADIILLIENEPKFGVNYWCIQDPNKKPTEGVKKEIKDSGKKKLKIIKGVRS